MPLDGHATILVPKVRSLRHMAEEADLDDPREHLDARQELQPESRVVSR